MPPHEQPRGVILTENHEHVAGHRALLRAMEGDGNWPANGLARIVVAVGRRQLVTFFVVSDEHRDLACKVRGVRLSGKGVIRQEKQSRHQACYRIL